MTRVMQGIRVLEVAQHTFVPAAAALLADWGADVVKIEHPVRGDTMRGFVTLGGITVDPDRNTLMEHPNRGKRSVGLDVSTEEGQQVLYEIAATADVFLTNYLPFQRQKLRIDLEHIRAVNPNIIYARGSAYGDKGPERDVGGFDGTAFWSRSGVGHAFSPPELGGPLPQAIPAFGDSIGGLGLAAGISAALDRSGVARNVLGAVGAVGADGGPAVPGDADAGKACPRSSRRAGAHPQGSVFPGQRRIVGDRVHCDVHRLHLSRRYAGADCGNSGGSGRLVVDGLWHRRARRQLAGRAVRGPWAAGR